MMTDDELLVWGRSEDAARKADLAKVSSADDLKRAQGAARKRRLAVGLSAGEAVRAVKMAQMDANGDLAWFRGR